MFTDIAWAMGQSAAGSEGAGGLTSFIPLIIIFVIFYFLLIRPQQQKQKKHREMIRNLKKGDQIVTMGGIYGTITDVDKEIFTIKIANNVEVKIRQQAVSYIQGETIEDE